MTEVPEDQVRGLEREGDAMEKGLERLEGHIDTAQQKAEHAREQATPDAVAGDWQDESAGAQQGDDAQDAEGREGPGGEGPGEPQGEGDSDAYDGDGGGGGSDERADGDGAAATTTTTAASRRPPSAGSRGRTPRDRRR
jgi:hypothetical protein